MVKELRTRTGLGMMACKKALAKAEGNIGVAIEQMRKSGLAKADKKSDRIVAEGVVAIKISANSKLATIIEVNCETDFFSKSDDFVKFANDISEALLVNDVINIEQLHNIILNDGNTIDAIRRELVAKFGENIAVRRSEKFNATEGACAYYLHGSRIGVIVELAKDNEELGKDIAMHIAASNPFCVSEKDVPIAMVNQEKEIFVAQAATSDKPAAIIEKIIAGRTSKYLAEITLEGQAFIKDDKVTVGELVKSKGNAIVGFSRYEVGEGIEKKQESFAQEVMAQVRGES